ncbi:MAG: hypothetical protein WB780_15890 [Candidatus Acidiferrales bacterium]
MSHSLTGMLVRLSLWMVLAASLMVAPCVGQGKTDTKEVPASAGQSNLTPIAPNAPSLPLGALDAVNELQALAWSGISKQTAQDAAAQIEALDGQVFLHQPTTCLGIGFCYVASMWLTDIKLTPRVKSPPGFRYVCGVQSECERGEKPGFRIEAPLKDSWAIHLDATVNTRASVWGLSVIPPFPIGVVTPIPIYLKCCDPQGVSIDLSNIKLTETTVLDTSELDRPTLTDATITGHMTLQMTGGIYTYQPADLNFAVSVAEGGQIQFTDPNAISAGVRLVDYAGVELPGSLSGLKLGLTYDPNNQVVSVQVSARIEVTLAEVSGHKIAWSDSFSTTIKTPVPSGIISALTKGLPISWGENPPAVDWTKPADPSEDFNDPANQMESAITAHLPWGAVLSIDNQGPNALSTPPPPSPPPPPPPTYFNCPVYVLQDPIRVRTSPICFNREFDTAIWTGHYLAAEAFRYAATQSPQALARVKQVLGGMQQLFWVTQGSAVSMTGQKVAVTEGAGLLSRVAIPKDRLVPSGAVVPLTDDAGMIPGLGICYFERAEGGWDVEIPLTSGSSNTQHFSTYEDVRSALAGLSMDESNRVKIRPIGRIWYGIGCGEGNEHPISRDQYVGTFMGLALANALVPDPDVQNTTKTLITEALDFFIAGGWDMHTPPKDRIPISSTFLGNWDFQLGLLRIGATVNPSGAPGPYNFGDLYNRYAAGSKFSWIPTWISVADPDSNYFEFNLSHAVIGPTLFFETDSTLRANYLLWYNMLRRATRHHKNAYFNLDRILIELPANRAGVAAQPSYSNPNLSLQDEIKGLLEEWLMRLNELGMKAPDGLPYNFVSDPAYEANLFRDDRVALYKGLTGNPIYAAKYAMPMWARQGNGMDFVWEHSPFDVPLTPPSPGPAPPASAAPPIPDCTTTLHSHPLPPGSPGTVTATQISQCGSDLANQEAPGVDYLLAYWLAVYLNVLPKPQP